MSPLAQTLCNLARRLMDEEARAKEGTQASGAHLVCRKLGPHLASLMGSTGFRVLLMRALQLVREENLWLRTLRVEADGALGEVDEAVGLATPASVVEGSVILVAQLLALLEAFIGQQLTLRLVQDLWPALPLEDFDPGNKT